MRPDDGRAHGASEFADFLYKYSQICVPDAHTPDICVEATYCK